MRIGKNALMLLLIASFLMGMVVVPSYAQMATLSVDPAKIVTTDPFFIDIYVDDVENMWGFQFKLVYDTSVLTATAFMSWAPFTTPQGPWPSGVEIHDAEGYVEMAFSYPMGEEYGETTTVPVLIATIDFSVDAAGASPLQIVDSHIADVYGNGIGHTAMCGEFRTTAGLPMAKFTMTPETPIVGETVTFTSTSTDEPGTIVAWDWDFGDGTTGTGETVTHAYTETGDYTVTLTVTDDDALTDSHSSAITVSVIPPPGADLLMAESEYRKLNVAARKTCKLMAKVINLDEEEAVLVRVEFFVYDETMSNLGVLEVNGTVDPGETADFQVIFNGTDPRWEIRHHPDNEWIFRAEVWYNDFVLPTGDLHWTQIEEPTEIWFVMRGKNPFKWK